ncbi:glycosyltransferase [Pseudomonas sp. gcc21]|uniref:glycosyltransferase family 2 protein n=1 Tax=Pseudomonas sp. gcc21 TaxID=2726989 RepID=UPI0014529522|nr:glycosyltransferase family 2 protein [Pseudomonas sp. gcc21]QJD58662.1 glycosyltransferase [Pseudomonas sp. gcc21]
MKVSVITVCYNSETTVREAINSVLSQDYTDLEYIVVDGCSKDSTLNIINEYSTRVTRIVSEPDKGLWDAMNKGIELSTGDCFCFLNSDDFFADPGVVTRMVRRLTQTNADAVYGYVDIVDPIATDKVIRRYRISYCNKTIFRLGMMPAHPGFMCKRSFFERYGGFLLDDAMPQDFELLVRYLAKGNMKAKLLPEVIVRMRNGGVSNRSFMDRVKRVKALVDACRMNGVWTSIFIVPLKYPVKIYEYVRK